MVAIPKIVLKSQTRMTLNERFTQYSEQQHARVQMLKNDLHTRFTEDAIRRNGGAVTAELSRKLDNLQKVIESQIRRKSPSPLPPTKPSRYSPEPHRPTTYGRYEESMIVPEYRALLYHGGLGDSGIAGAAGRSGQSWRNYNSGSQSGRKSRYDLTYGDVIQSGHRDYDSPSSSLYADVADRRESGLRHVESHNNIKREYRDYWPSSKLHGGSFRRGGYGVDNVRSRISPRMYSDRKGRNAVKDAAKRKYDNPLMRDSSASENDNHVDADDSLNQEFSGKKRLGGVKSRLGVRSRIPFKTAVESVAFGHGMLRRVRFNRGGAANNLGGPLQRSRSFSRPMIQKGGGASRSRSQGRPVLTKEDLDKELDEYHRKKGIIDEASMQVDS